MKEYSSDELNSKIRNFLDRKYAERFSNRFRTIAINQPSRPTVLKRVRITAKNYSVPQKQRAYQLAF